MVGKSQLIFLNFARIKLELEIIYKGNYQCKRSYLIMNSNKYEKSISR